MDLYEKIACLYKKIKHLNNKSEENNELLNECEELIKNNPKNADLRYIRGKLLLSLSRGPEAGKEFEIAFKLNPDLDEINYQLFCSNCFKGDYAKARMHYSKIKHKSNFLKICDGLLSILENESVDKKYIFNGMLRDNNEKENFYNSIYRNVLLNQGNVAIDMINQNPKNFSAREAKVIKRIVREININKLDEKLQSRILKEKDPEIQELLLRKNDCYEDYLLKTRCLESHLNDENPFYYYLLAINYFQYGDILKVSELLKKYLLSDDEFKFEANMYIYFCSRIINNYNLSENEFRELFQPYVEYYQIIPLEEFKKKLDKTAKEKVKEPFYSANYFNNYEKLVKLIKARNYLTVMDIISDSRNTYEERLRLIRDEYDLLCQSNNVGLANSVITKVENTPFQLKRKKMNN